MPDSSPAHVNATRPASIPSGTVAFLFTDIEGSTQRWEHHHDAMALAVARHDALVRGEIERHGGFVFKTVGDAFCAAFLTPHQALHAALSAQRRLRDEDFSAVGGLRVRMGIHVGTAVEREADYFGPTVNRAARLMSIGHGGQVLVSDAVRLAVGESLATDASLVDLGLRRLKDLMQPERVWQASVVGLPSDFAPLTSLDARPNNLPLQSTALLGRERDLSTVKHVLSSHALVTISGAGGVGKTRLAVQVGADLIDFYERGVWFADLAPIAESALVPSAIAQALEFTQSGESIEASLLLALKRQQLLLILDNCEHVLETVARLADSIVKTCPQVRILTTSRQPLGVAGECVHRLPSLSVPDASTAITAEDLLSHGATALFVERAGAANNRFELSTDTAPIVADICRRLDGIPLAIELAAARVQVLALPNLAKRLDDRFRILTGGSRTALPRQKTLSAMIDWSYGLLKPGEQACFDRLGVFAGGFSLEAAVAVAADHDADEVEMLEVLSSLVDQSLVLAETGAERERYRLLESTRAYALEKLEASGDRDAFARRHAEYYRAFSTSARDIHRSQPAEKWLPWQEPELDNIRSALNWALQERHDIELGAAIAASIFGLWQAVGLAAEARRRITFALELIDATANPVLHADLMLALCSLGSGDRYFEMSTRAKEIYEKIGDAGKTADALYHVGWQHHLAGRDAPADEAIAKAAALYRRHGPELALARSVNMQAILAGRRRDSDAARTLYREALEIFRALGDERRVGGVLSNLGSCEASSDNFAQAEIYAAEALEILSRKKNIEDLVILYGNLTINRVSLGKIQGAREAGRAGMVLARDIDDDRYIAELVIDLGSAAARSGGVAAAARLYGYARKRLDRLGLVDIADNRHSALIIKDALQANLAPPEVERLLSEGAAWSRERAIEAAMQA